MPNNLRFPEFCHQQGTTSQHCARIYRHSDDPVGITNTEENWISQHNSNFTAHLLDKTVGCLFWVLSLIYIIPLFAILGDFLSCYSMTNGISPLGVHTTECNVLLNIHCQYICKGSPMDHIYAQADWDTKLQLNTTKYKPFNISRLFCIYVIHMMYLN